MKIEWRVMNDGFLITKQLLNDENKLTKHGLRFFCFRIMEGQKVIAIDEWLMNQKDSQRILVAEFWPVN